MCLGLINAESPSVVPKADGVDGEYVTVVGATVVVGLIATAATVTPTDHRPDFPSSSPALPGKATLQLHHSKIWSIRTT